MIENETKFPTTDPEASFNPKPLPSMYPPPPYHPPHLAHPPHGVQPPKPVFTAQEEFIETSKRVNNALHRIMCLEDNIRNTLDSLASNLTADNVTFKNLCITTYNTFSATVKDEINSFEAEISNSYALFEEQVKNEWGNFNENFTTFKAEVDEKINEFNERINETVDNYRDTVNSTIADYNNTLSQAFNGFVSESNLRYSTHEKKVATDITEFKTSVNKTISDFRNQWAPEVDRRLDEQDRKISNVEFHFKTNFQATVERVVSEMAINGDLADIIESQVVQDKASKAEVAVLKDKVENDLATKEEVEVERQRINNLSSLPEGSTQGNAELLDIRIGADGTTYSSAGEAVRQQITKATNSVMNTGEAKIINDSMLDVSIKPELFTIGSVGSTGWTSNTTRFCSVDFLDPNVKLVTCEDDYSMLIYAFDKNYDYVGRLTEEGFSTEGTAKWIKSFDVTSFPANYQYRIMVRLDDAALKPSEADFNKITFYTLKSGDSENVVDFMTEHNKELCERLYSCAVATKTVDGVKNVYAYRSVDSLNDLYTYKVELTKGQRIRIDASNLNRCAIVVYNKHNVAVGYHENGEFKNVVNGDKVLVNDNSITEYVTEYEAEEAEETIFMFLGSNQKPNVDVKYVLNNAIVKNASTGNGYAVDLGWWLPPEQPDTWSSAQTNTTAYNCTKYTSERFVEEFYDIYLNDTYENMTVEKNILGQDETGQYNIYEFIFTPKNYKRTILIETGMHTYEYEGYFGFARMLHYIMNEPDIHPGIRYIRDNVRLVVIPTINPWGMSQQPHTYGNVNGVNINRNFAYDDYWCLPYHDSKGNLCTPNTNEWNHTGDYPFSEAEAVILRDWLIKWQGEAEFLMNCHTGVGWDRDVWCYYVDGDSIFKKKIQEYASWHTPIWAEQKGVTVSELHNQVNDPDTSYFVRYAYNYLGIPACTVEYVPNRIGGTAQNDGVNLQVYLRHMGNIIIHGLCGEDYNAEQTRLNQIKVQKNRYRLSQEAKTITSANGKTFKLVVSDDGQLTTKSDV